MPLDGSELAERVILHARALAGPSGTLLLYRTLAPFAPVDPDADPDSMWTEVMEDTSAEALAYLERVATPLRADRL